MVTKYPASASSSLGVACGGSEGWASKTNKKTTEKFKGQTSPLGPFTSTCFWIDESNFIFQCVGPLAQSVSANSVLWLQKESGRSTLS